LDHALTAVFGVQADNDAASISTSKPPATSSCASAAQVEPIRTATTLIHSFMFRLQLTRSNSMIKMVRIIHLYPYKVKLES